MTNERILVVDDEEQMRDLLAKVLEKSGYQVAVCGMGAGRWPCSKRSPWTSW